MNEFVAIYRALANGKVIRQYSRFTCAYERGSGSHTNYQAARQLKKWG
ncbi:hypothetical protein N9B46_02325 [Mariniblastus sp.]|nr:hypothetical protein [bacterium]MDA7925658.1 hypothetical protein [Mariniblastus sp.]